MFTDSGSTVGTPIIAGVGAAGTAYPLPYTLLSVGRFAQMIGINPAHFFGATAASLTPAVFPAGSACADIWPQHDWQKSDQVSREGLVLAIQDAEKQLANILGYWTAPMWIANEIHPFPRDFYRESLYQITDLRGMRKSMTLDYGKIISGGQRAVTLIGTAATVGGSLAYTDNDGDGFAETATITLATTLTDACGMKVYYASHDGEQEWEVRPVRTITIGAGILTIVLDAWLLIDPALYEVYPTDDGFMAIDISTTANYVASVDVYYEYTDATLASAVFHWENDVAPCDASAVCEDTTQDGCMHVRDADLAKVVPVPAIYSSGWASTTFDVCRAPDRVAFWYYAGAQSNDYQRQKVCDPLAQDLAWLTIWLAVPKLDRSPCSCNRLETLFDYLRTDLSENVQGGSSFFPPRDMMNNPFGTHRGEVMAWNRIKHWLPKKPHYAVV
jgi:hypothetical protein